MRTERVRRYRSFAVGLTSLSLLALVPAVAVAQSAAPAEAPAASAAPADEDPSAAPYTAPAPSGAPATATVNAAATAAAPASPGADAAAAETAAADAASADAEAAAIEQQVVENSTTSNDFKVDLYGFADFTYGIAVKPFAYTLPYNSFAVGNLNLYLASSLGDKWKSLAEVRFSYLPHGATQFDPTGNVTRTDTTVPDYTDLGRPSRWGGIMIQRAYLEYDAHPLFNVRAGHFLTPYGIWNVDHGSPVIIGVRRPYIIGEGLIPQSQTGLEIYGSYHLDPVLLGYHLTLSNGRGPIDTYQDLNNNKAIGGRLFGRADTPAGAFTLGASAYKGRYTDRAQKWAPDSTGSFVPSFPVTQDYNEQSLAGDLKWELGGALVQGEVIMNDVVYDRERPTDLFPVPGAPGFVPDHRRVGFYGLGGYRFGFLGTMPFAGAEYYYAGPSALGSKSAAFFGGLNVRPTARVVLKAQYTYSWFPDPLAPLPENSHYNSVDLQAAWSF